MSTPKAAEAREAPAQAKARGPRLELECAIAIGLMALGCLGRTHIFMLEQPGPLSWDEGYMAALAARLIHTRWLPGVDAISQRGPILYWTMTVVQWLGGWDRWVGVRVLAWLVPSITVCALIALGIIQRRPLAGAYGALLYAFVLGCALVTGDGIGINGEHFLGMYALLATAFCAASLRAAKSAPNRGRGLAAVGGVMVALAGFSKQIALPAAGPLLLWLVVPLGEEPAAATRHARTMRGAFFVGGWLLVALLCISPYVVTGHLDDFWYNFYRYNTEIFLAPYKSMSLQRELAGWFMDNAFPVGTLFMIGGLAATQMLRHLHGFRRPAWTRALQDKAFELVVLALFLMFLWAMIIQMKWWHHQMVAMIPFLGLLFGMRVETALQSGSRLGRTVTMLAQTMFALCFLFISFDAKMLRLQRERVAGLWTNALPDAICELIHRHSAPDDSIYVWGFDGDVYVTCSRRPATRYVYSTMVAGIVPPFWNEWRPDRVARHARENTVEDLETNRPKIFVDMPMKLGNLSMLVVPEIREYIQKHHYCDLGEVIGKLSRVAHMWKRPGRHEKCPKALTRFPTETTGTTSP
jgi:hypothetical protein